MRKLLVVAAVVALTALAAAAAVGRDRAARPTGTAGALRVRVPGRWHELRGWLSDVVEPVPLLAVASFPAKLSRTKPCECGLPNILNFPRNGAFVFVWEYPHPSRQGLAREPRRPDHFHLTGRARVRRTCNGPTDVFGYKEADRVFQVEVYLGPGASQATRRRTAGVLDSLRVTREA